MMQPQFLFRQHEPTPQDFPILPDGVRIGRVPDNTVVLDDDTVSRYHAIVWEQGGQVFIRDENSANGTQVGEQDVPPGVPYPMQTGDQVRVGAAMFSIVANEPVPSLAVPASSAPAAASPAVSPLLLVGGGIAALLVIVVVVVLAMQGSSSNAPLAPLPPTLTPKLAPSSPTVAPALSDSPTPPPAVSPPTVAPPTVAPPAAAPPTAAPQQPARPAVTPTSQILPDLLAAMERAKKNVQDLGGNLDQGANLKCEDVVRNYELLRVSPTFSLPDETLRGVYTAYRRAVDSVLTSSSDLYTACRNKLTAGSGEPSTEQRNIARQSISNADSILHEAIQQSKQLLP